MAGITQLVDERIELLRRERAEMDELKADLEKREAALELRKHEDSADLLPLEDKKALLTSQIEEAKSELTRLRTERLTSIETFGIEMDSLHASKTSESVAQTREIQGEIAFLLKGKEQVETELDQLHAQVRELEERRDRNQKRISEEKEAHLSRAKADREAALQEAALQHSVTLAEMDRERKSLENQIEALEQTKAIEWNKAQAEITRYKTAQFAELDAQKEALLAEAEQEKSTILGAVRAEEKRQQNDINQLRREWEKEELVLQAQKRQALDEIKLLEYEYEKVRSENIVKLEKARVEEMKTLETIRVEALAKLEAEQGGLVDELKRKAVALRTKIQEDEAAAELAITECENKKANVLNDIELLEVKYEQLQKANEAKVEALKIKRLQEVDDLRIEKLKEVEELRQQRVADLESIYLEKANALEVAREEKLAACIQAISDAEAELNSLKTSRLALEQEIAALRLESSKLKKENHAMSKAAMIERELEIERLKSEKMAEIEAICDGRLRRVEEKERALAERVKFVDDDIAEKTTEAANRLSALQKQSATIESEMEEQKLASLQEVDELRVAKLKEIEELRQQRVAELEAVYLEKVNTLDAAREEKLEACTKAIADADSELSSRKTARLMLEQEITHLRAESEKIKKENQAAAKAAGIERELEFERVRTEKMAELEGIFAERLRIVEEKERSIIERIKSLEDELFEKTAETTNAINVLQTQQASMDAETMKIRHERLSEVEQQTMDAMEELSKMKLSRMQEIESYLETYKEERMANIQKDFDRQIRANYKSRNELSKLNEQYNKRMEELQQMSLDVDTAKRTLKSNKQRIMSEIERYKNLLTAETKSHKQEMETMEKSKDEQIKALKDQLARLTKEAKAKAVRDNA